MIRKCCSSIAGFAKRRPSLFIVIILIIIFLLAYGTYQSLHATSSDKFCGMCHVLSDKGPGSEYNTWKTTAHAFAGIGCIDCHGKPGILGYGKAKMGGLYDLYSEFVHSPENKAAILLKGATDPVYAAKLVPKETCLFCHTTEVNSNTRNDKAMSFLGLEMRTIDSVQNPEFLAKHGMQDIFTGSSTRIGGNANHATHIKTVGLDCTTCHMGVAHSNDYYTMTAKMQDCFTCHDTEREATKFTKMPANDDCVTCHSSIVKLQKGDFLEKYGIDNQTWMMAEAEVTCDGCHETAFAKPTAQKCVDCHDASYSDMFKEWRQGYDDTIAPLTALWNELLPMQKTMDDATRAKFNDFKYLYRVVSDDSSKSVHNTFYIAEIIAKAVTIGEEIKAQQPKK